MGQRLVLTYTMESHPSIKTIAIYQHWSGYTSSAIETASQINNWIEEFQQSELFASLTVEDRFAEFAKALGTSTIIEGAYFKQDSVNELNKNYNTNLIYNEKLLKRNDGLVGINDAAEDLRSWAEMASDYTDVESWFADKPELPDQDMLSFFDQAEIELTFDTKDNINPLDLSIKDLLIKEQNNDNVNIYLEPLSWIARDFDEDDIDNDPESYPVQYNKSLKDYIETESNNKTAFYESFDDIETEVSNDPNSDNNYAIVNFDNLTEKGKTKTRITVFYRAE